jgi:hypothetical protein
VLLLASLVPRHRLFRRLEEKAAAIGRFEAHGGHAAQAVEQRL